MKYMLLVALGGAFGAVARYWLTNLVAGLSQGNFPLGTLVVNLLGSFMIGILYVLIVERLALQHEWRHVAMIGFLGALTTFSTFSLETLQLLEGGHLLSAGAYVMVSVIFSLMATWSAISLVRLI